jgi:hypothetical protein
MIQHNYSDLPPPQLLQQCRRVAAALPQRLACPLKILSQSPRSSSRLTASQPQTPRSSRPPQLLSLRRCCVCVPCRLQPTALTTATPLHRVWEVWSHLLTDKTRTTYDPQAYGPTPFSPRDSKVLVNPRSKGITSA